MQGWHPLAQPALLLVLSPVTQRLGAYYSTVQVCCLLFRLRATGDPNAMLYNRTNTGGRRCKPALRYFSSNMGHGVGVTGLDSECVAS